MNAHTNISFLASAAVVALLLGAAGAEPVLAQISERLRGAARRASERMSVDRLIGGRPITTSLEHARWSVETPANLPPDDARRSMLELRRTPNGGFTLEAGYWEMHNQSYCLHAGTYGPGGGDGYLYAPLQGRAADAVTTILRKSANQPDIAQSDIQTLLWAIVARAKLENLTTPQKVLAARLLTPQQLTGLNRSALDLIPGDEMGALMNRVPGPLRQVVEAEANLRRMVADPTASFAEMERVAVLTGAVGMGPGSRAVPSGRWSLHPDGYYVRYIPQGYSYTVTQIWVPQGSPAVGKEYDPATHIAVPGNAARQRLVQSGRARQQ